MRLGVEMVHVLILAPGPFSAVSHAGEDQPLEPLGLGSRVEDVFPLLQFVVVRPLVLWLACLRRLHQLWVGVQDPEVRHAEDRGRALERRNEACSVAEVGLDNFHAFLLEVL